jgi:hypothetical protein
VVILHASIPFLLNNIYKVLFMGAEILGPMIFAALTLFIFLIVMAITLFQYQSKRFENDGVYFRHRCFWLSVAFLPILLALISLSTSLNVHMYYDEGAYFGDKNFYDMESFWHRTALWVLIILTTTFGPAIHQNRSDAGLDGILLLFADCCGLAYAALYLSHRKDSVSSLALLGESAALTAFAFAITLAFAAKACKQRDIILFFILDKRAWDINVYLCYLSTVSNSQLEPKFINCPLQPVVWVRTSRKPSYTIAPR